MPRHSPYVVLLSDKERVALEQMAGQYTSPYYQVIRSKIVLLAAEGLSNKEIAQRLDIPRPVASRWRKRFFEASSGTRRSILSRAATRFFPLRWSFRSKLWQFSNSEIAAEAVRRGFVAKISGATVWRRLNEDAIRPWHHRSWIFPRDPNFEIRAGRVLDLYHRQWQGKRLGPREYLLSADEKTSIQARARKHDHCHRARTASCAWSTSTNGRGPWPIWLPWMCTIAEYSVAVNLLPASNRSIAS